MPSRFNDHERSLQHLLAVQRQNAVELCVHGGLIRWQDAQIDNSRSSALHEHQRAEITVARHKDPRLLARDAKQLGIECLSKTNLSSGNNIMAQATQESNRDGIDILIGEKLHGIVARRMSSAATTSMAY